MLTLPVKSGNMASKLLMQSPVAHGTIKKLLIKTKKSGNMVLKILMLQKPVQICIA
jgi:hypothetical protein